MRSPFAPIEAGPTQDAARALSTAGEEGIDIHANSTKQLDAGVGYQTSVVRQLRVTARN